MAFLLLSVASHCFLWVSNSLLLVDISHGFAIASSSLVLFQRFRIAFYWLLLHAMGCSCFLMLPMGFL